MRKQWENVNIYTNVRMILKQGLTKLHVTPHSWWYPSPWQEKPVLSFCRQVLDKCTGFLNFTEAEPACVTSLSLGDQLRQWPQQWLKMQVGVVMQDPQLHEALQEAADRFWIGKASVYKILHEQPGMSKVSAIWMPWLLVWTIFTYYLSTYMYICEKKCKNYNFGPENKLLSSLY